jgi:hypothetical protein
VEPGLVVLAHSEIRDHPEEADLVGVDPAVPE